MRIRKISLAGFRGIRSLLEIPCGAGFTVICGPNGSGKSTICDALEFLLTGTLERFAVETERREHIADYLWWRGRPVPENRYVAIEFSGAHLEAFTLRRDQASAPPKADTERLVDMSSAPADWAGQLCRTSILRDDTITTFSTDQSERERSEFTLSSIGLTGSTSVEQNVSIVLKELDTRVAAKALEYQEHRAQVERWTTELSEARTSAAKASEQEISRLRRAYAEDFERQKGNPSGLARVIAQQTSEMRTRTDNLIKLRSAREQIFRQTQELETESFKARVNALSTGITSNRRLLADSEQAVAILRAGLQAEEAKSPITSSLAMLVEHGRRIGLQDGRCPLCGSILSEEQFKRHLSDLESKISRSSETLSAAVRSHRERTQELAHIRERLTTLETEFDALGKTGAVLRYRQKTLDEETAKLGVEPNDNAIAEAIEKSSQKMADLANDFAVLEAFISIHRLTEVEELLRAARKRAEEIQGEFSKLSRTRLRVVEARDAVNRVSTEIIGERLAFLKPSLIEFCDRLRPHPEWTEIDMLLRGDVRPFVSFLAGKDLNPRFVFSSGQRRALGLAFLFSVHLSRPWCRLETLMLDDPVQHIDDYRALHMVETLSSMRMLGHQIICTTEDPALADLLCRRLRSSDNDEGVRIDLEYVPRTGMSIKRMRPVAPLTKDALAAD
jgi:chromosome segregation protein